MMPEPFFTLQGAALTPVQDIASLCNAGRCLEITSQGIDPILALPELCFDAGKAYLVLLDASGVDTSWDIYWIAEPDQAWDEARSRRISVRGLEGAGAVSAVLPRGLCRQRLRLDPGSSPGKSIIRSMEIYELPEAAREALPRQTDFTPHAFCQAFCGAIVPLCWSLDRNTEAVELGSCELLESLRQIASCAGGFCAAVALEAIAARADAAKSRPACSYLPMPTLPELAVPGNALDLVLAPEYFLAVNENFAVAWIEEIYRILKPGGLLALAYRPKKYLDECARLVASGRAADFPGAAALSNKEQRSAQYDMGEYIWHPLASVPHPWQGVAVMPEAWFRKLWRDIFLIRADREIKGRMAANLLLVEKI